MVQRQKNSRKQKWVEEDERLWFQGHRVSFNIETIFKDFSFSVAGPWQENLCINSCNCLPAGPMQEPIPDSVLRLPITNITSSPVRCWHGSGRLPKAPGSHSRISSSSFPNYFPFLKKEFQCHSKLLGCFEIQLILPFAKGNCGGKTNRIF